MEAVKITLLTLLALAVIAIIIRNIRIVPQNHSYLIEFLGKYRKSWQAGIHVKIPFLERVSAKVSLKEQVYDYPPQTVITKDNVSIDINAVVFAKVFDPYKSVYNIEDSFIGLENLSATTLRNVVGEMELDECLSSREKINAQMQEALDDATDEWGIKVRRVEIKDINPPREIEDAMTKQMKAEREKRQAILEAEAHKESVTKVAEGDKAAKVLAAEAEREAKIAIAEGEAKAIEATYNAQARGLEALQKAKIDNSVLYLRGLDALKEVADGRATKIFVPTDIASVLTSAGAIGEALGVGDATTIDKSPKIEESNRLDPTAREGRSYITEEVQNTVSEIEVDNQ